MPPRHDGNAPLRTMRTHMRISKAQRPPA
jgi:hypothetical protein